MTCSRTKTFAMALLAVGLAVGCSKQQPPPATAADAPVAEEQPKPAPAPKAEAPAPAPVADNAAVFFDFDSAVLKDEARPVLQKVAEELKAGKAAQVRIEGNCDDVGTPEYNLALGENRAKAAREYLTRLGVPAAKTEVVSYGSLRPKYQGTDDDSRAKNRRADLVLR